MDREKLLASYRSKKNREDFIRESKEKIKGIFTKKKAETEQVQREPRIILEESESLIDTSALDHSKYAVLSESTSSLQSLPEDIDEAEQNSFLVNFLYYTLWFILWLTLFIVFVELGFGIIYLIISALFGMYINTRTGPKKPGEVSAYSVFNKNCESIDGTLKAEQFEREIRYGAGGVR